MELLTDGEFLHDGVDDNVMCLFILTSQGLPDVLTLESHNLTNCAIQELCEQFFGAANRLGWLFPKEFREVPEMVVVLVATAVSETVPQCPSLTPYTDYMCPQ